MENRYYIIRTLIKGEQNLLRRKLEEGEKLVKYKKPVAYAVLDRETGDLMIVDDKKVVEIVDKYGAVNVNIVVKRDKTGDIKYMRAKEGYMSLQHEQMVMDIDEFTRENSNAKILELEEIKK